MKLTNQYDIPLPLQIWLLADDYDFINNPKYISATNLLKPIKSIILSKRATNIPNVSEDISSYISRRLGTSIHSAIENSWVNHYKSAFKLLNLPESKVNLIRINPEQGTLKEKEIPVYLEQRSMKEVNGYTIGGKFDMVLNGELNDFKSTSTFSYMKGSKVKDYILQGSIYRYLNQDKVTSDYIVINYIFTDWSKLKTYQDPEYPKIAVLAKKYPLKSIKDTEEFIKTKLALIDKYMNEPEENIPECNDEDLWRGETVYKYYTNPTSTRSTKNFDSIEEANAYLLSKGNKGIIKTVSGSPRRCLYCNAFCLCKQRQKYFNDNREKVE